MRISVEFDANRGFSYPMYAKVKSGNVVSWNFRSISFLPRWLRWTIYFPYDNPFKGSEPQIITAETIRGGSRHIGRTATFIAVEPGEYKYGIKLQEAESGETLGDDDPYLLVT